MVVVLHLQSKTHKVAVDVQCVVEKCIIFSNISRARPIVESGRENRSNTIMDDASLQQFRSEQARLDSFADWTVPHVDKGVLARYGFYYLGKTTTTTFPLCDMVRCFFCRVEIGQWEVGDNVLTEHLRWSPFCPLLRGKVTNNVPLNENFSNLLPTTTLGHDVCGDGRFSTDQDVGINDTDSDSDGDDDSGCFIRSRPKHSAYSVKQVRLNSFTDWPKSLMQKPEQLSDAGFFYTGRGDLVECFCCGGGLRDWEPGDDPHEQHLLWYGDRCEYLKLIMSDRPVERTTTKEPLKRNDQPSEGATVSEMGACADGPESDENDRSSDKMCKICLAREYTTAYSPCGHVVACVGCALSVSKCPLCRQSIASVMRIYLM